MFKEQIPEQDLGVIDQKQAPLQEDEVEDAVRRMRLGKAAGTDNIPLKWTSTVDSSCCGHENHSIWHGKRKLYWGIGTTSLHLFTKNKIKYEN